jgi:phenylpyruvate tautomerase PptA (4-oxalocrotonate tautomerase family)
MFARVLSKPVAALKRRVMPLWNIYCPEGAYSRDEKRAFADQITDLYAEFGLPRFYVNVMFNEAATRATSAESRPTSWYGYRSTRSHAACRKT